MLRAPALTVACLLTIAALGIRTACADPAVSYDPQRGRLLYETQCGPCHTAQVHWRDKHVVRNWRVLVAEVARWARTAGQSWSDSEIGDVAAYLNGAYYKLPCSAPGCEGPRAARGRRSPEQALSTPRSTSRSVPAVLSG